MAPKDRKKNPDLIDAVRVIEINERPEKEAKKFEGRRKFLKKIVGKKDGGLAAAIEKVKKEDAVKMQGGGDPTKKLVGGQKKLDKNKDGRISGEDFKLLRAEPMKLGGVVKMTKGGGVCKGMGIARAGGKFKLR